MIDHEIEQPRSGLHERFIRACGVLPIAIVARNRELGVVFDDEVGVSRPVVRRQFRPY